MFSFYEFLVRKGWSNNYKIALSWTYAKHFLLRKALAVPRALNALMNGCVRLANAMLICTLRSKCFHGFRVESHEFFFV